MDTFLTVDEAARALRVSRATVYKRIATGQMRAIRLGTGEKAPLRIADRLGVADQEKPQRDTSCAPVESSSRKLLTILAVTPQTR